jgi:hypothetical protein
LSVGPDPAGYGTHSIRRTKASLICRRTKNLRAAQLSLAHSKLDSTVRYLGIEVDDALELTEQTNFDQRPLLGATAPAARPAQFGQNHRFSNDCFRAC